jgi:amino acid adenylation domain-containing protein
MSDRQPGSSVDCVYRLVRERARHDAHAPAILAAGRKPLSYGRLAAQVDDVVAALGLLGIGRQDRIALVLPDGPELAVAFVSLSAGATVAPLRPEYRTAELAAHFGRLGCKALVTLADGAGGAAVTVARARGIRVIELTPLMDDEAGLFTLAEAGHAVGGPRSNGRRSESDGRFAEPDDVALALFTSGTSAVPKLVPLTHRNLCAAARNIQTALELTERDRCLNVMPLVHIHGLSTLLSSFVAGGSVVCDGRFDPRRFFQGLDAFHPTWYTAAPTIHRAILDAAAEHAEIVDRSRFRFIRSASAPMPNSLAEELARVFRAPFVEAYGMTEAAPHVSSNGFSEGRRRAGSVGIPDGIEVAVLDEAGAPLPSGRDGEVVIRGPSVARGYDDPESDRDAFIGGWLRTGDRGHLDENGFLFITGRTKELINRGGEKISPAEIDRVLLDHPTVRQAVTFSLPHPTLGEDVAAAIVLAPEAAARDESSRETLVRDIRQFAAARLAEFKVPQVIRIVSWIAHGPTGKVRRADLPAALGLTPGGRPDDGPAPRTDVERRLAAIWASVLEHNGLGVHANFFHLGGDSLKATQVISRIGRELGIVISPRALFERPTIAELAEHIGSASAAEARPLRRRASEGPAPLSAAQRRLWLVDQLEPGNPAYNMHTALRLSGRLDRAALELSLTEIVRRHEALRTTFRSADGQPVQVVGPPRRVRIACLDLTSRPTLDREQAVERLASEEARRPFHLAHGPLFRATLFRLGPEQHVLLVAMHHIVSDGWSTGVLLRELQSLYPAFASDRPSPLAELPIQYADFSAWESSALAADGLDAQLDYWRTRLDGLTPLLDLPADRPRPATPTRAGASVTLTLPPATMERLRSLSVRENVSPFMTALAAFQTLLHRYTGQTDIAVGTPIANRNRIEVEGLIGFFANTLVMRTELAGNPTFREVLERVRATATGAYAHRDLPFERLVEALAPERDPRHEPLFQVMFAFQNLPDGPGSETWGNLAVSPIELPRTTSKFDLTVYLTESARGLITTWQFSTELFDRERIARMAGHFETLLDGILANPDGHLGELPLLRAEERSELVTTWSRSGAPGPGASRCFHELFEDRARLAPDAVAVSCDGIELTYGELDRRANVLARRLESVGVGPDTLVGVFLGRSTEVVTAVLAIMKAGGAYVPLDPSYPAEHLGFVLRDARVSILITEDDLFARLGPAPEIRTVVRLPLETAEGETAAVGRPSPATGANLAYVIYTSGSTGKPKGAMITHGNLAHYVRAMGEALGIEADDRYLHTASFAFSSSVRQLAVPLAAGARVVIAPTETIRDPGALFELIKRERVSIIDIVPSYWRACTRALGGVPPEPRADLLANELRLILSASEPLGADLPADWEAVTRHGARLVNMFGQTETTGIVTLYLIPRRAGDLSAFVPIGRPIGGTRVYVLDRRREPVPIGVWGELYVGGPGVGLGYLNDAHLTAEHFVSDPFGDDPAARLYRTGDIVRWLLDGELEFRGRSDQQVKLRGYRIDPGLIERVVEQHPDWCECAVAAEDDPNGHKRLVAYVAPAVEGAGSTRELREHVKRHLPDYMVPAAFVVVGALPRTPSGKLDRMACGPELGVPGSAPPARPQLAQNGSSPPIDVERMLAGIWARVLDTDEVSLDDNFFDLGGNSILALEMIARAGQVGLRITPKQLWQHQTIGELAQVVVPAAAPSVSEPVAPSIPRFQTRRRVARLIDEGPARVRVSAESLRAYGCEALERAGLIPEGAAIVTDVQLEASLRDQPTHNMVSIPRYARRILAGTINPRPNIRIERQSDISARIDGDNGPGQWVAVAAMEAAIRIARKAGIGVVGVRRSNHLGAAGHYPWLAAREGLIGLCTTNGPVILAPTGGVTPTFGNNPLGVGIPAGRHHPILLDIAMSVAPRGRIGLHLAEGKPLPPGWILDRNGNPSTDPADLVAGLGVPIGGHKGYGLTLIMEVLAGVLTGASFGWDNRRDHTAKMTKPADFGHFFLAIDPELFLPNADFTARVDRLIEQTKAGERATGVEEILVPGEAELRARERSLRDGVPLRRSTYESLLKYARAAKLATELTVVELQDVASGNTSSSGTG